MLYFIRISTQKVISTHTVCVNL